jgi:hypothetical protein
MQTNNQRPATAPFFQPSVKHGIQRSNGRLALFLNRLLPFRRRPSSAKSYPSCSNSIIATSELESPFDSMDTLTPIAIQPDSPALSKFRKNSKTSMEGWLDVLRRSRQGSNANEDVYLRNRNAHRRSKTAEPSVGVIETNIVCIKRGRQTLTSSLGTPEESQTQINQYHLLQDIGSGAFGRVVLCRNSETSRYYACKIISKTRLKRKFRFGPDPLSNIQREVAILKKLSQHRNINALIEVLDDEKEDNLYMSKTIVPDG